MWKLGNDIFETNLNSADEEFINLAYKDIEGFLKNNSGRCVLLFPPFNNRKRYFIHKLGEVFKVKTFSVGEGVRRVTVVCSFENCEKVDVAITMNKSETAKKGAISKSKRTSRPDAPIYVPPAIRRVQKNQTFDGCNKVQKTTNNTQMQMDLKEDKKNPLENISNSEVNNTINQLNPITKSDDKEILNSNVEPIVLSESINAINERDIISENVLPFSDPMSSCDCNKEKIPQNKCKEDTNEIISAVVPEENVIINSFSDESSNTSTSNISENISSNESNEDIIVNPIKIETLQVQNPNSHHFIKKEIINDKKDSDQDQEEMLRASEEINRRNKKIIKQSFNKSDILIISNEKCNTSAQNDKNNRMKENDEAPVDCWEDLLEDGQLDSNLLVEINYQVGKVNITKPKEDYTDFKNKVRLEGDFSHVLEIYDFPKEFQTRDLVSIIDSFKIGVYHIKWVDDNHALGVFSSGFAAQRLLDVDHPLIKVRPLNEGSKQSISKALRYPNTMMPSAVRPQTCAQTARRIVHGALGLKLQNSREERAKEIKILKEAREKRRLSAKQQDDAWEGKLS